MGVAYASNVIVAIIAEAGRGLTKKEIFRINKKYYKANLKENWVISIATEKHFSIYEKKGRYYLKPDFSYNPDWKKRHVFTSLLKERGLESKVKN